MSTAAQSISRSGPTFLPIPTAAFEVLAYLGVVAIATLCFLLGWLPINGAVVLTVLLLSSLIFLSWKRFDQGRHPCFLFLCVLLFFQGGRLLAYCFGAETDPMRIRLMVYRPFNLMRDEAGIVLLCLVLSAICIYVPCRWNYRRILPPTDTGVDRFLPYLYLLFYGSLPVQLFKNYRYFEYIQDHGGYLSIFLNHSDLASSVPLTCTRDLTHQFSGLCCNLCHRTAEKVSLYYYSVIFCHFFPGFAVGLARGHIWSDIGFVVRRQD